MVLDAKLLIIIEYLQSIGSSNHIQMDLYIKQNGAFQSALFSNTYVEKWQSSTRIIKQNTIARKINNNLSTTRQAMTNKANINPTWELGSPSIAQALPSNMKKSFSQAQLPTKKPQKQPKQKTQPKTQSKK